jgi:putative ABC transport system permease protein
MFRNYLKTCWRNLWHNKAFTFINVAGLTIGLSSFLLIALYIFDELTYDKFHKDVDNIYRIVESKTFNSGKAERTTGAGYQVSERAKAQMPEIKEVARLSIYGRANIGPADSKTNTFHEEFIAASANFLQIFNFPVLQGNRATALAAPNSIVLTQESAKRFFGTADAIGKILLISDRDSLPYTVTAVLKDIPSNSSITFNFLISEATVIKSERSKQFVANDWGSGSFSSYFLFNDNVDIKNATSRLNALIASNRKASPDFKTQVELQAFNDIHFQSGDIEGFSGKKGNLSYIYVFLVVGCFIIFIACINYMNLSTARFTTRGKEIAIRKVSGASRVSLTKQFLIEALIVTLFSVFLSIGIVNLLLPAFNAFTGKELSVNTNTDPRIWFGISGIVLLVTLAAGLYPALFQAGLNPLSLLKTKMRLGKGNISLRQALVVFQFTVSIVLIAATIIIYKQMKFVNQKDMGFDKDKLVVVDINSGKVRRGAETIKDEFSKLAQVKSVTITSRVPGEWKGIPSVKVSEAATGSRAEKDMFFVGVDSKFIPTYNIKLLNGRNFSAGSNTDSSAVLINETAAKALGITELSGQTITIPSVSYGGDYERLDQPFVVTIAGIVKDFNFQSLHEPLAPIILAYQNNPLQSIDYFTVKIAGGNVEPLLKEMDAILHQVDQGHLFEYHFLDKQWELFYQEDKIRQTVFFTIALLAILIAAMGLFGLTTYAAEQRVKEIGIRKVLGASVGGIVLILSKDFLKLILIASLVALPVAWFFMHKWLQDFAYRIDVDWWILLLSAFAACFIALITISFQSIKAAIANPITSLRSE